MNITQKIILLFLILFVIGLGFLHFMPREEKIENNYSLLRIGAGDDITGLLLEEIIKKSKEMDMDYITNSGESEQILQDFTFKDC